MIQNPQFRSQEYRISPTLDAERLIKQVVASGVPRFVAEPAIIKHERELSSKVAYG